MHMQEVMAWHSTAPATALACDNVVVHMQGVLAALFAAGTVVTTLNTYGLSLLDPSKLDLSPSSITAALPGTLAFFALLGQLLHHSLTCLDCWLAFINALRFTLVKN